MSAKGDFLQERTVLHRHVLHSIPELNLELPKTKAYILDVLKKSGIEAKKCADGFIADIGNEGPLVAMRADMDALPVTEETGLAFASTHPGCMHACGHDVHTAALLACAEYLAKNKPEGYRVRLIFQPAEETVGGADFMVKAGCLEGVKAIVGGHVGKLSEELTPGIGAFINGAMMASIDDFEITLTGSGGHGASPHQTIDPIPAAATLILALEAFRSRVVDQRDAFVLTVGQVVAGSANNIIPNDAYLQGTVRCLSPENRLLAKEGIERVISGVASSFNLKYKFVWNSAYPPLINDEKASMIMAETAKSVLGQDMVKMMKRPVMGGEDFAYYTAAIPGAFWFFDTCDPKNGKDYPNHHPKFDVDESLLGKFAQVNLDSAEAIAFKL